jgi:excisionase family DNA binding protein
MTAWSDEEFLTVAEVAARLKLNQQTIRNWIEACTLPAVRVGRRVRILQSDFDAHSRQLPASTAVPLHRRCGAAPRPSPTAAQEFWDGELSTPAVFP